jgi:hypothetical protein
LLDDTWSRLERGVVDRRAAFHTPVVATASPDGTPDARCVVLREVSRARRTLTFHADARSEKVRHVRGVGRVTWVFYDAEAKLQVRVHADASVHVEDAIAEARWDASHPMSRACYASAVAPGQAIATPGGGDSGPPEAAWSHFAAVLTRARSIDRLDLDVRGHRRLRIDFDADGSVRFAWVQP